MPTWNPWHGCTKISPGCYHCYMYRRDAEFGKDSSVVTKTSSFDLPLRKNRQKQYKLQPEDGVVFTCFTSDFFHPSADEWRPQAWAMMKERQDLSFYFITKRPHRFYEGLPSDWGDGYENVTVCCTCENQSTADKRLPVFLELPLRHREIIHEPMLERINIEEYLAKYHDRIECVSVGGESGDDARELDYAWVLDSCLQCMKYDVPFSFHQTGYRFRWKGKLYRIPRKEQHIQAKKANLDYNPAGFAGREIPGDE